MIFLCQEPHLRVSVKFWWLTLCLCVRNTIIDNVQYIIYCRWPSHNLSGQLLKLEERCTIHCVLCYWVWKIVLIMPKFCFGQNNICTLFVQTLVFFLVFIYEKECKMEKSIYGKRRLLREPLVIVMNYFLCLVRNPTCEPMLETKRAFGHLHELFMFGQEPHLWAHAGDQVPGRQQGEAARPSQGGKDIHGGSGPGKLYIIKKLRKIP